MLLQQTLVNGCWGQLCRLCLKFFLQVKLFQCNFLFLAAETAYFMPSTKVNTGQANDSHSSRTPQRQMAPVKSRERQWYDVGIFKNSSAVVSQFYLLPEETLNASNKVAARFLWHSLHLCIFKYDAHMLDNKMWGFLILQHKLMTTGVLYFMTM